MEPSLKLPVILPAAPDAGCVRGHKKPLCGYRIDQFDIFPIGRIEIPSGISSKTINTKLADNFGEAAAKYGATTSVRTYDREYANSSGVRGKPRNHTAAEAHGCDGNPLPQRQLITPALP